MSATFEPQFVPSDIISRWPSMALELWKRSFSQQAGILMAAVLMGKFFPAWSEVISFLIAPSLFIIAFTSVQMADERAKASFGTLMHAALPSALRLGYVSVQFAALFGIGIGALSLLASSLAPAAPANGQVPLPEDRMTIPALPGSSTDESSSLVIEFIQFCASWTDGVMTMMFLGLFIVAIYQGIFGAVLHAQHRMHASISRNYGWQAWEINMHSIETAVREAPPKFFSYLAAIVIAVICGFQTVYLSPVGLILATYIPCLSYVAYRSIFLGKHENVPETRRITAIQPRILAPAI